VLYAKWDMQQSLFSTTVLSKNEVSLLVLGKNLSDPKKIGYRQKNFV